MDDDKRHSLGRRAFLIFLSRRIKWTIILFLVTLFAWYGSRWIPASYNVLGSDVVIILTATTLAIFLFAILQTWLEYRYYTYTFTEEAFLMTYGYLVRNEVAALYHQIQNVSVQRGVFDRFVGVSQVVIFLTGAERESDHNKIVLPAVGSAKAKLVQKELLVRARRHAG